MPTVRSYSRLLHPCNSVTDMTEPALLTKKGPKWNHVVVLNQPVEDKGKAKGDPNVEYVHCETSLEGVQVVFVLTC